MSGSPVTSTGCDAKRDAAVVVRREPGAVDQRAPRAVEHEDPLPREPSDLRCHVPLRHVAFPMPKETRKQRCRGSLGVCSTGRQAAFKALRFQLPTGYPPCPVARWRTVVVGGGWRRRAGLRARLGGARDARRARSSSSRASSATRPPDDPIVYPRLPRSLSRPHVRRERLDERVLDAGVARQAPHDLQRRRRPLLVLGADALRRRASPSGRSA